MKLSDAYLKAKRNTLAYGVATTFLWFIPHGKPLGVKVLDVDISIPLRYAAFLLLAFLTYSMVSFCIEWSLTRQVHSQLLNPDNGEGIDAEFAKISKHAFLQIQEVDSSSGELLERIGVFRAALTDSNATLSKANLTDIIRMPSEDITSSARNYFEIHGDIYDRSLPGNLRDDPRNLVIGAYRQGLEDHLAFFDEENSRLRNDVSFALIAIMEKHEKALLDISSQISKLDLDSDRFITTAKKFHKSIKTLNRNLYGARKFSFYFIDFAACLVVSVTAYVTLYIAIKAGI